MLIEAVNLKHVLTDKEMADMARAQAQAIDRLNVAEGDLSAIKKQYAGTIALARAEIGSLSARVQTGFDMRNIRCLLLDERPEGYRLVVRLDDGHIAIRRRLEQHERQLKLTTDEPREFTHQATLKVDAEDWDADVVQVLLYLDEAEELQRVGGIEVAEWTRRRALAGPAEPKGKKK